MQDEDADLVANVVLKRDGLARRGFERDGEIAGVFGRECGGRGEAEDVGRFVLAAEGFVEVAEGGVVGEEDVDCAFYSDGGAGAVEEAREGGGGEGGFD